MDYCGALAAAPGGRQTRLFGRPDPELDPVGDWTPVVEQGEQPNLFKIRRQTYYTMGPP